MGAAEWIPCCGAGFVTVRVAGARLLAELPTIPFTERLITELTDVLDAPAASRTVGSFVGPEVDGQRLLFQLRPGGIAVPFDEDYAVAEGMRAVEPRILQVMQTPPGQAMEALFGWVDPGVDPNRAVKMAYGRRENAPKVAVDLQQTLGALAERAGMQSGDVLINTPYGINKGDYTRAKAYMRQGFGPPSAAGDQIARIGRGGVLEPELLTSVHPGLAAHLGWAPG